MSIATSIRCSCGDCVEVEQPEFSRGEWRAMCNGCYDGAEDAGPQVVGYGDTANDALWDWQDKHDERWEVEWTPRDEFDALDKQIAQEALRQLGWERRDYSVGIGPFRASSTVYGPREEVAS